VAQAQAQRLRAALHSFTLPNEIPLVLLDWHGRSNRSTPGARDTYMDDRSRAGLEASSPRHDPHRDRAAALAAPSRRATGDDRRHHARGFARFVAGYAAAAPILRRGIAALVATPFTATGISRFDAGLRGGGALGR
jgi:hypothetical protein